MDEHPELRQTAANASVFALLDPVGPAPAHRDRNPYLEAGHHPDVVHRVWDELGAGVPQAARCRVAGNPVLAHPGSGRILAFPRGTAYALWLAPEARAGAELSTRHQWGSGSVTDLGDRLEAGWYWGRFDEREPGWCVDAWAWWDRPAGP